ncbi:MAG: transcription initiation factor IIB [Candidatus Nezhaarchaeales archaeon]
MKVWGDVYFKKPFGGGIMSTRNVDIEVKGIDRCPDCGSSNIIRSYDRGELTCMNCGLVIDEKLIDQGPEWRAFTPEEREKRDRVGPPISTTSVEGVSPTVIQWPIRDSTGHKLSPQKVFEVSRWRRWQIRSRIQTSQDRNIQQATNHLERIAFRLNLPQNVKEEALKIYKAAVKAGLVRGRSIESVMAASIYAACRQLKIPRTLDEIADCTRAGRKDVARCYRLLLRHVKLNIPIADPVDFVPRIVSSLSLSGVLQRKAIEIIQQARKFGLTAGKDPAGLAAAAIYIASLLTGERKTQKEIARAAQVTEVTVRNRYKELIRKLKIPITS